MPPPGDDGTLQAAWLDGKLPAEWRTYLTNAARDIVRSKGRRSSAGPAPTPSTAGTATAKRHSSGSAARPPTGGGASMSRTEVEPEEIVLSDKARC